MAVPLSAGADQSTRILWSAAVNVGAEGAAGMPGVAVRVGDQGLLPCWLSARTWIWYTVPLVRLLSVANVDREFFP